MNWGNNMGKCWSTQKLCLKVTQETCEQIFLHLKFLIKTLWKQKIKAKVPASKYLKIMLEKIIFLQCIVYYFNSSMEFFFIMFNIIAKHII